MPLHARINVHETAARSKAIRSIKNRLQIGSEHAYLQCFSHSDIARFAARLGPGLQQDGLAFVMELFLCMLVLDDAFDDGSDNSAVQERVLEILHGSRDCRAESSLLKWWAVLIDILRDLHADAWYTQFAAAFTQYIQACSIQATIEGQRCGVGAILHVRGFSSGALPTLLLLTAPFGETYSAARLQGDVVLDGMIRAFVRHVAFINDVVSLGREFENKEGDNIVMSLAKEEDIAWSLAIDRVVQMCDVELKTFLELEHVLHARVALDGTGVEPGVVRLVEAMKSFMRGNLDWSYETDRYGLSPSSQSIYI